MTWLAIEDNGDNFIRGEFKSGIEARAAAAQYAREQLIKEGDDWIDDDNWTDLAEFHGIEQGSNYTTMSDPDVVTVFFFPGNDTEWIVTDNFIEIVP